MGYGDCALYRVVVSRAASLVHGAGEAALVAERDEGQCSGGLLALGPRGMPRPCRKLVAGGDLEMAKCVLALAGAPEQILTASRVILVG